MYPQSVILYCFWIIISLFAKGGQAAQCSTSSGSYQYCSASCCGNTCCESDEIDIGGLAGGLSGSVVVIAIVVIVIILIKKHQKNRVTAIKQTGGTGISVISTSNQQQMVSAPQPGYVAPQPGYVAPQPGYVAPQPGYAAPHPGYTAPHPGYATQPGYIPGPQPSYGAPVNPAYPPPPANY